MPISLGSLCLFLQRDMLETQPVDWVVLGWVVFVSVVLVAITLLLLIYQHFYTPVRAKNVPSLVVIAVAGLIHTWATLISNEHIDKLRSIRHVDCILWSFVFQYLLGINVWFLAIIHRILTCAAIFRKLESISKSGYRWAMLMGGLCAPMVLICMFVWGMNGMTFLDGTCVTGLVWKAILSGWIIIAQLILVALNAMVNRDVGTRFFNELRALMHVTVVCVIILMVNGFINFAGLISTSATGRSIYTFNIALLHLFTLCRLCLHVLVRAILRDRYYADAFCMQVKPDYRYARVQTMDAVMADPEIWDMFLKFCAMQEFKPYNASHLKVYNISITGDTRPAHIVSCIHDINAYFQAYKDNKRVRVDNYMDENALRTAFARIRHTYLVRDNTTAPITVAIEDKVLQEQPEYDQMYLSRYMPIEFNSLIKERLMNISEDHHHHDVSSEACYENLQVMQTWLIRVLEDIFLVEFLVNAMPKHFSKEIDKNEQLDALVQQGLISKETRTYSLGTAHNFDNIMESNGSGVTIELDTL
jgi:hypothetical protein